MSPSIVGVHGIRCYGYYEDAGTPDGASSSMSQAWSRALAAGAGIDPAVTDGIKVAYYSHLLHQGTAQGSETDLRWLTASEQAILADLIQDLGAPPQVSQGRVTVPVRQIAQWLAANYGDAAVGSVSVFCREVDAFLANRDDPKRKAARDAVAATIAATRPRAVVAHSLGSVVAYEALHHHPDLDVELLLTIGSPLGMRHVVMDRLDPPADQETGRGARPPGVAAWVNIADRGDIVAATTSLAAVYDGVSQAPDIRIGTVAFHSATAYLAHPAVAAHLIPYLGRP
jgi:hypothetical protein